MITLTLDPGQVRDWLVDPARLNRFMRERGDVERWYLLDYQIVCYLELPLFKDDGTRRPAFDAFDALLPEGFRYYRHSGSKGVFYITYMHILPGNCVVSDEAPHGTGFHELLWGIQVQPKDPRALQSRTLITGGLTTTDARACDFLEKDDRYRVHRLPGLRVTRGLDYDVALSDAAGPICTLRLGETPVSGRRWMFAPGAAEVFKPQHVGSSDKAAPPLRYDFTFWGLFQLLRADDLRPRQKGDPDAPERRQAAFTFHPHALFEVPTPGGGGEPLFGEAEHLSAIEIAISRPGTAGIQLLSPSVRHAR